MIDSILKYFPDLSTNQINAFSVLMNLYPEWNSRINVISRKDIENLEINHILHSLAIAKFLKFVPGTKILDFGTGGGFPGLPLAILFPHCEFTLVDRTAKKLKVASEIAKAARIENVTFFHGDVNEVTGKFDFVISRAVMPQHDLIRICRKNIAEINKNALPNGLITLKGGDLTADLGKYSSITEVISLDSFFHEPFFETKKLAFTPLS